jgi:hypothetical protein
MVLIIPMSGQGKRFAAAGYDQLKPLITIEGKPAIAHVLDMFPGEDAPLFICNQAHLETTPMRSILQALRPNGKIIAITGKGQGPVPDIQQVYEHISDTEDVMISYCDFTGRWDYAAFKSRVKTLNVDGAIPSYIGFHPHLLGPDFYGHMRWKKDPATGADMMIEMQEKKAFTDNKMNEYGAVGMYWFKSGALMKKYFDEAVQNNYKTGHEFFCSMPYNYLVRDGLKVWIPEMQHFCQWGTPQDLEEYEAWSRAFAALAGTSKGTTNIPASRSSTIKARPAKDHVRTFQYWADFFTTVSWHPYGKQS